MAGRTRPARSRKSVPISHTPKVASSGIVVEEDPVQQPPEALESERVLPDINSADVSGNIEEDEVL